MPKTDQARPVPAERLERLSAWARRKPRVALMGEFSSGKSTLLNLLIGEDLLPTKVTATELPPVWFSHGTPRAYWVGKDGTRHALDFGTFDGVPAAARYVRVFTPAPVLERCDIIDTPGISDPNLEEDSWRFAVGQANFMLWCSPATQAWRETERSTWLSLPERLRANSVMVVTRADKLGPGDREKVTRRLTRESFGLFGGLVLLSSLDAVRGQAILAQTGDDEAWRRSGGADLDSRLEASLAAVRAGRLDLLDRYVPGPASRPAASVTPLPLSARASDELPETASPAPLLPFGQPEAVRPRRVELPETRRAERPQAAEDEAADPLRAIRAGWMSLRSAEETPEERAEPAPVLRLLDPIRTEAAPPATPEPRVEGGDDHQPLILDPAWAAFAEGQDEAGAPRPDESPTAQGDAPDEAPAGEPAFAAPTAQEVASLEAVLAAVADSGEGEPDPEPKPAEPLPRAVRIWREIVERTPEIPSNSPILDMIEQLLIELSRDNQLSDAIGQKSATAIEQNRAA